MAHVKMQIVAHADSAVRRSEMVGRLARGIAHDINNVLSVILSYAELIGEQMQPGEPVLADVDEIRKAGLRAADLTRQLLAIGQQRARDLQAIDLGKVVAGAEKLLRRCLGGDIELTRLSSNRCWPVKADLGQIEHVILNLALSARDAMPTGGWLTIETRNVELESGPHVMLALSHTGHGLEPADPIEAIVTQSGGHMVVEPAPNHGTALKLYFPRALEPAVVYHPMTVPPMSMPATETILLVAEDDQVCTVAAGILRREGYRVLTALNAGEALITCEQHASRIDLLLTDISLPRISGRQLASRLADLRPEMRVLFMAGGTEDEIPAGPDGDFVAKPLTPTSLTRKIREVLDGGRGLMAIR